MAAVENAPAEFGEAMFMTQKTWVKEVAQLSTIFLVLYFLLLGLSYIPR